MSVEGRVVSHHRGRQMIENLNRSLLEADAERDEVRKQDLLALAKERSLEVQAVVNASVDAAVAGDDEGLKTEWRTILREATKSLNEIRSRTLNLK